MTERNGNEKYGNLPQRLPTNAQQVRTINTDDLMLYGSDCLVLFYERFNTPYSYTRLGPIAVSAGLAKVRGSVHGWGAHPPYHFFATRLGIRPAS